MLTTLEADIKKRSKSRAKAFSRVGFLIVLLLFVYLSGLNLQIYLRNKNVLDDEVLANKRFNQEEALNRELKKQILLFSENDFVEQLIREKLGMVKPGETAYRIVLPR